MKTDEVSVAALQFSPRTDGEPGNRPPASQVLVICILVVLAILAACVFALIFRRVYGRTGWRGLGWLDAGFAALLVLLFGLLYLIGVPIFIIVFGLAAAMSRWRRVDHVLPLASIGVVAIVGLGEITRAGLSAWVSGTYASVSAACAFWSSRSLAACSAAACCGRQ